MAQHTVRAAAALGLAGFRVEFKSYQAGIISVLKRRYGPFLSGGRGGIRLAAVAAPGNENPFKPAVKNSGNTLEIRRGDFRLRLDLASGAGALSAAPNEQCLDAFLRSLLSFLLIRSGGLMLHSAGLVKNGRAYLFLGKSGAGKSTLSKLAAGAGREVISDEINLLRPEKGRFMVYGSPFWGEMRADGRPGRWPLGGVFILKKARANAVSPCGGAEALKLSLRCLLNFEKGPAVSGLVLGNAARLLAGAKFARLEFSKSGAEFLELI